MALNLKEVDGVPIKAKHKATCHCGSVKFELDLPDGLVTRIANLGTPLQPLEFLLLKLAAAILSGPQIVLLNQHFDAIPHALKARLLRRIYSINWTVLYFTNMPVDGEFDGILALHDTLEVTAFTPNTAEEGTHE